MAPDLTGVAQGDGTFSRESWHPFMNAFRKLLKNVTPIANLTRIL